MQKVWYLLLALDRLLSANVLCSRLTNLEESKVCCKQMRRRIAGASKLLEPHICRENLEQGVDDAWLKGVFEKLNQSYTLDRVIDAYCFEAVSSGAE